MYVAKFFCISWFLFYRLCTSSEVLQLMQITKKWFFICFIPIRNDEVFKIFCIKENQVTIKNTREQRPCLCHGPREKKSGYALYKGQRKLTTKKFLVIEVVFFPKYSGKRILLDRLYKTLVSTHAFCRGCSLCVYLLMFVC